DKSALERKTYLLDPSNYEIDDEIFNVKIKFHAEKTYKGDSIEGNYLFIDADIFKERIMLKESFTDGNILKGSLVVHPDYVNEKGGECNTLSSYPSVWNKQKGLCSHERNYCFKKQLDHFVNLEKQLDHKKLLLYNYSFFMLKKSHLSSYKDAHNVYTDLFAAGLEAEGPNESRKEGKMEDGISEDAGVHVDADVDADVGADVDADVGADVGTDVDADVDADLDGQLRGEESPLNGGKNIMEHVENNYYVVLEKKEHNFIEIISDNNEELNIYYDEQKKGESVSFVHSLSNCYDFNNELYKHCTIYISIWNEENVDKELNISINCNKRIVHDMSTLRRKMFLCKMCESTITIKFEPIVDLLVTPCSVVITREVKKWEGEEAKGEAKNWEEKDTEVLGVQEQTQAQVREKKRGYIREKISYKGAQQGKDDKQDAHGKHNPHDSHEGYSEEHFLFSVVEETVEEGTSTNVIFNMVLTYNVPENVLENHIKQLYLLDDVEDNLYIYRRKIFSYITRAENIIKMILFVFVVLAFFIFVIPSMPICRNVIIKMSLFHKLKTTRMLIMWKLEDMYRVMIRIPGKFIKIFKKIIRKVKKVITNIVLTFRKDQQLIDQTYREKQERKRKNDEKKKIKQMKYEKRKKEKEDIRKRRYKRLLENEEIFKKEMAKEDRKNRRKKRHQEREKTHTHRKLTEKHISKKREKDELMRKNLSVNLDDSYSDLEKNRSSSAQNSSTQYVQNK
ncbi:conserved Plasmodium protein, unknown function, partial [Plasmodium malariae]